MSLIHELAALDAPPSLTPRQQEFCLQFVLTNNKAKSARLAGYTLRNSSSIDCRLLKRDDIRGYVRKLRQAALDRAERPNVLDLGDDMRKGKSELVASLSDLFEIKGGVLRLRNLEELKPSGLALIQDFEANSDGMVSAYKLDPTKLGPAVTQMMLLAGRA